jgi:hypothetical protein
MLFVLGLLAGFVWLWVLAPRRIFYGPAGPTPLGKFANWTGVLWANTGLPPKRQAALEIRGRKSGEVRRLPVVVAVVEGERYLVSMMGERAWWARNARAGMEAWLTRGRREPIRLVEVPVAERAPILKEYLRLAPGARSFFPIGPSAPEADFVALADHYPTFRVEAL